MAWTPKRASKPWTADENAMLMSAWRTAQNADNIAFLAVRHDRSVAAIAARLKMNGVEELTLRRMTGLKRIYGYTNLRKARCE